MPAPKVRKTWVVSFTNGDGYLKHHYFQSYNEAQHAKKELPKNGYIYVSVSHWIDGAELLRLARLGYEYDSKRKQAVKMKHYPRKFLATVDAMPQERIDDYFLDYRNFKTSDDVIAYQERNRSSTTLLQK